MHDILDCRGLHPPEPLVRILALTETLKGNEVLEAWLERRPLMLFPELAERGLVYRCDQRADGTFVVRIAGHDEVFGGD